MTQKCEHGNWQFKLKIPKLHDSHAHHVFQAQQIYVIYLVSLVMTIDDMYK